MAQPRTELHEKLVELLGSRNVYFQPTTNVRMQYHCIVYKWDGRDRRHADNDGNHDRKSYQVTVIDREPDCQISDLVEALSYCSMTTTMVVENLNYYFFNLAYWEEILWPFASETRRATVSTRRVSTAA